MKKSGFLQLIYQVLIININRERINNMNIKSKFSILVAIIFSLSLGLTKVGYSDGHGGGMNVPKIEVSIHAPPIANG